MNLILYMPDFARIPVGSLVLLALAVVLSGICSGKKLCRLLSLPAVIAAVSLALLADGDKLLLAAALLLSAGAALATGRRNGA